MTNSDEVWKKIKTAIGRIDVSRPNHENVRGTCFLVSDRYALTAAHVVFDKNSISNSFRDISIEVTFAGHTPLTAYPVENCFNIDEDWALLEFKKILHIPPIPLGDEVAKGSEWDSFGFPDAVPIDGLACLGKVRDQFAQYHDVDAFQLFCEEAAAGDGGPVNGYSGAPCIVNGFAVGLLRAAIMKKKATYGICEEENVVHGTLYACPISLIAKNCKKNILTVNPYFYEHLYSYLNTLETYCKTIPYLSLQSIQPHRAMDEVYVNLRVREHNKEKKKSSEKDKEKDKQLKVVDRLNISPAEMIKDAKDDPAVIIGEPGAGKSTLLQHFALHSWTNPFKIGLTEKHLPILIHLSDLANMKSTSLDRFSEAVRNQLGVELDGNFLEVLHHRTTKPLLLLLDGLDEVPSLERPKLVRWLNTFIHCDHLDITYKIIIASRPTGYTSGELGESCKEYELLPFSPDQIEEFASKWFPQREKDFLQKLELLCPMELRGTPLLITIAAKVYYREGDLPQRRSILYQQFIDIWLDEAVYRDLKKDLRNERLTKVTQLVLSKIAKFITEANSMPDIHALESNVQNSLENSLHIPHDEAEIDAQTFLSVMSRRSGVFIKNSQNYEFIHPTFREYLTAYTLVRDCSYRPRLVFKYLKSHGLVDTWREIGLFALGIMSDQRIDVTEVLKPILPSFKAFELADDIDEPYHDLMFVVSAVADGANVQDPLKNALVARLVRLIKEEDNIEISSDDVEEFIKSLESLKYPYADEELRKFVRKDGHSEGYVRFLAMRSVIGRGIDAPELKLLLDWCFGKESLNDDITYNIGLREDSINLLEGLGYKLLAQKSLLSLMLGICNNMHKYGNKYKFPDYYDRSLFAELRAMLHNLLNKALERDNDFDYNNKELSLLFNKRSKMYEEVQRILRYADSISLHHVLGITIINLAKDRAFCVEHENLNIILAHRRFKCSSKVKSGLRKIALDLHYDDWHRAECALALARYYRDLKTIDRLLNDENYCYLEDSYARDYAEKKIEVL